MTEIAIQADHLSKRFWLQTRAPDVDQGAARPRRPPKAREFWALRDASFAIERGSTFGLVGSQRLGEVDDPEGAGGHLPAHQGRVA